MEFVRMTSLLIFLVLLLTAVAAQDVGTYSSVSPPAAGISNEDIEEFFTDLYEDFQAGNLTKLVDATDDDIKAIVFLTAKDLGVPVSVLRVHGKAEVVKLLNETATSVPDPSSLDFEVVGATPYAHTSGTFLIGGAFSMRFAEIYKIIRLDGKLKVSDGVTFGELENAEGLKEMEVLMAAWAPKTDANAMMTFAPAVEDFDAVLKKALASHDATELSEYFADDLVSTTIRLGNRAEVLEHTVESGKKKFLENLLESASSFKVEGDLIHQGLYIIYQGVAQDPDHPHEPLRFIRSFEIVPTDVPSAPIKVKQAHLFLYKSEKSQENVQPAALRRA